MLCYESQNETLTLGCVGEVEREKNQIPIIFITMLMTRNPALEQSINQQYVVWLTSYVYISMR